MTLKMRIELIFLGIVATAVMIAIMSLAVATHQALHKNEIAVETPAVQKIENSETKTKRLDKLWKTETRDEVSKTQNNVLEYDLSLIHI